MKIIDLELEGPKLLELEVCFDERGFFCEYYRNSILKQLGVDCSFIQDNLTYSKKGVLRGMHFQEGEAQEKLVSVISGKIYDVFVDIRKDSATFGRWESVILDSQMRQSLFIPKGFAHGFYVLSEEAYVTYKIGSFYYNPGLDRSIYYDDPDLQIKWPEGAKIVSKRDQQASSFRCAFL